MGGVNSWPSPTVEFSYFFAVLFFIVDLLCICRSLADKPAAPNRFSVLLTKFSKIFEDAPRPKAIEESKHLSILSVLSGMRSEEENRRVFSDCINVHE